MADFLAVSIENGYATTRHERDIIISAGGEFIDADDLPLAEALKLCEQAEGVLVRRMDLTAEIISNFGKCKVIVRYGVGTDNVDVQAATEAGIIVGNVPDYCVEEVSSHAVALLLACIRHLVGTAQRLSQGAWNVVRQIPIYRMAGKTLGIVGLGQIGRAVARKLSTWGLTILAVDPFVKKDKARSLGVELVDLETLCRSSDYISMHLPLLPETRHIIGPEQFELTKPDAILVNTARGSVVDTWALLEALGEGKLARAGLDVFESEPLEDDSPLRSHPAVIVTDHMSWYSEQAVVQLQSSAAQAIVTVCKGGLPGSLSNPEVIKRLSRVDEWQPAECMCWQLKRLGWRIE